MRQKSLRTAMTLALLALPSIAFPRPLQVSPTLPSDEDRVLLVVSGYGCAPGDAEGIETAGKEIRVRLGAFVPCFRPFYWSQPVELGRFAPGPHSVEVTIGDEVFARDSFVVREAANVLELHGQRFQAQVEWTDHNGLSGFGTAVPLSDESGYFWFFESTNIELVLKVLDARSINDHFWVFLSSLTDVEVTVTVLDIGDGLCLELPVVPPACPTRTYTQPAGENRNVLDTEAFRDDG